MNDGNNYNQEYDARQKADEVVFAEDKYYRLDAIRKHSTYNQPDIAASEMCGCYSCMNMFSWEEIKDYVPGYIFATAKCPVCGRKTVLPEHIARYVRDKTALDILNNL